MKRIQLRLVSLELFLFILLGIVALTNCDVDHINDAGNTDYWAAETFSFNVPVENRTRFSLRAINGPIDVVGVPGASEVQIWGERRVGSFSVADAQDYLRELEVRVIETINEVGVETIQPNEARGRNYQVIYHVRIPDSWRSSINNINGEISVESLDNDLSINLINGGVLTKDIFGSMSIDVINGRVDATLSLPLQGTCDVGTINGAIHLAVPTNTSAEVSASVSNGTIGVSNNLVLRNMVVSPKSLRGTLSDGQGTITLDTINGNINLNGY